MDPSSELELELGTLNFPYKSISYALIELFNEFAFTEEPITIYLKEGTKDEITENMVTLGLTSLTVTYIISSVNFQVLQHWELQWRKTDPLLHGQVDKSESMVDSA